MAIDKLFRRNQNSKPNNFEYWLERGKGLLYFVHFDNQLAELAVLEAVDRLITACETEKKLKAERIRKTPNPKFRRRLDLTDAQRLQTISLDVSRECEKYQELKASKSDVLPPVWLDDDTVDRLNWKAGRLDPEELLVRFIAFMISEFFRPGGDQDAMVGISRLLHSYDFREMTDLYKAFSGEKSQTRAVLSDTETSDRKIHLITRIEWRFGALIRRADQANRKQIDFVREPVTNLEVIELITKSLEIFAPWGIELSLRTLSESSDQTFEKILLETISKATDTVEQVKMYIWVHPGLYRKIAKIAKVDPPQTRLAIPTFYLDTPFSTGDPPMNKPNWRWRLTPTPPMQPVNSTAVCTALDQLAVRRHRFQGNILSIVVDGIEQGQFHLAEVQKSTFTADPGTKTIQLYGQDKDGRLALATIFIDHLEFNHADHTRLSRRLENGDQIDVTIYQTLGTALSGYQVEVQYQKALPVQSPVAFVWPAWLKVVAGAVALGFVATLFWFQAKKPENQAHQTLPPPIPQPQPQPQPAPSPALPSPKKTRPTDHPQPKKRSKPAPVTPSLYVADPGQTELTQSFNRLMRQELQKNQVRLPKANRPGDYALETDTTLSSGDESFHLVLINPDGSVKWSRLVTITEENYREEARKIARELKRRLQ